MSSSLFRDLESLGLSQPALGVGKRPYHPKHGEQVAHHRHLGRIERGHAAGYRAGGCIVAVGMAPPGSARDRYGTARAAGAPRPLMCPMGASKVLKRSPKGNTPCGAPAKMYCLQCGGQHRASECGLI